MSIESHDILSLASTPTELGQIDQCKKDKELAELQEVIQHFNKSNVPNVNVPEKIIICLDICCDEPNSLFRLGDGTTFTTINMLKRILTFFLHSKHVINKKTEFALLLLKDKETYWVQNFTSDTMNIMNALDYIMAEEITTETFDFKQIFSIIKNKVEIPEYKSSDRLLPPPYVVRMLVLYTRSNCIPQIPQDDEYFHTVSKHLYFYTDILFAHEGDCALYKCEEIYNALQELDNGYSYVFEVAKNATKIHDCVAKLLAHPLQRPLQKNTDYSFGNV